MQVAMQQQSAGTAEYDVDYYFEVPLNAAKSLAGFRHDKMFQALPTIHFRY